jgi:hypothetical protein
MAKDSIPDPPSAEFVSLVPRRQRNLHVFIAVISAEPNRSE